VTDAGAWNEGDSENYRRLAHVVVPSRARQLATLASLLPFGSSDDFRVVEIGSGEGFLSDTIARTFPNAAIVALDGSASMRAATEARLSTHKDRVEVATLDLQDSAWFDHLDEVDAIVSSLVVHHLDGTSKRRLFETVARRSSERATLLIADIVQPMTPQARALYAAWWDDTTRRQAQERGEPEVFEFFLHTHWNIYRVPDEMDRPSPLRDQLQWMADAGFAMVDCFALEAGHAIYGGFKSGAGNQHIEYSRALRAAEAALGS
jgi:tRNA (cmo5U34)-methyltransferase